LQNTSVVACTHGKGVTIITSKPQHPETFHSKSKWFLGGNYPNKKQSTWPCWCLVLVLWPYSLCHSISFCAVAIFFMLHTVLGFLSQYLWLYPLVLHVNQKITVYCNNQGVIEWINSTGGNLYTWDTVRDDYPVYVEIQQQILQLHPITLVFQHVKGHQDTKHDQPLTTPECLNIDCDKQAANVLIPCPNPTIQNNPMIDSAYPHMQIGGNIIIQQLQHQLQDAATFISYKEYLQNKFQWTSDSAKNIHWKVHQLTYHHLSQSEC